MTPLSPTNHELRLKIAEVLGYHWTDTELTYPDGKVQKRHAKDYRPGGNGNLVDVLDSLLPNWPENIVDAWELVELMQKESPLNLTGNDAGWWVSFHDHKVALRFGNINADSAPRAIVLAFLAMKERK